jgi:hypothetical protein
VVPDDYGEFFVATATVAGALIGLLFVAISVRPEAAARTAHISSRLRSVAALSAFVDTLFLSLLALRPRADLGQPAVVLGAIGLGTVVTLLVLLAAQGRDRPRQLIRGVVLLLGQGYLFGLQLWSGWHLDTRPGDVAGVDQLTVVVLVLFALGIARAWEFAGADDPSLLSAIGEIAARRRAAPADSEEEPPAETG